MARIRKIKNPQVHEVFLRNEVLKSQVKPHKVGRVTPRLHKNFLIVKVGDLAIQVIAQLLLS